MPKTETTDPTTWDHLMEDGEAIPELALDLLTRLRKTRTEGDAQKAVGIFKTLETFAKAARLKAEDLLQASSEKEKVYRKVLIPVVIEADVGSFLSTSAQDAVDQVRRRIVEWSGEYSGPRLANFPKRFWRAFTTQELEAGKGILSDEIEDEIPKPEEGDFQ